MNTILDTHSYLKKVSTVILISTFLAACGGGGDTPENKAPTANAGDNKTVQINQSITINGSGTDTDGSIQSYEWKNGSELLATTASFSYTPTAVGTDTLTLTVVDNDDASASDNMDVLVSSIPVSNQAPVAQDVSANTNEDVSKDITLLGTDIDGDTLSYTKVSDPSHGSVSINGNIAIYTPTNDYSGEDSFTYKVNDGTLDSNTATVTVTISAETVNHVPVADAVNASTNENTEKTITLIGTDSDGDSLSYTKVTDPTHGSVSFNNNIATYTPTNGYTGADSFTYKVNDGTVDSNIATVTISVETMNHAPVADAVSASTNENTEKAITLAGTDSDGDLLNYIKVTDPSHGTISFNDNIATYTPTNDYNGADSFSYKVNDGSLDSNTATVSITVNPAVTQPKNWWRTKIDTAAIHPNSSTQISTLVGLGGFGLGRMQIDFSISVNNSDSSDPTVPFAAHPEDGLYLPDSDPVGTLIPVPAGASIEGSNDMNCDTSNDCHYIAKQGNILYEVYRANLNNGELQGQNLAIWDLSKLQPASGRGEHCTSADAAGFPIQPLLWNADEIQTSLSSDATGNGDLAHAIRFILPNNRMASDESLGGVSGRLYVRPATHAGGPRGPVDSVAYGARLKLRADFPTAGYNAATKVVINTMKRYGIALSDGGRVALTAESDVNTQIKWADLGIGSRVFDQTSGATTITVGDFLVIDTGGRIAETYECVRN